MSREEKRAFYQRMKKASYREFWEMMNEFHTLAYRLAEKHYQEAMEDYLQGTAMVRKQAKEKLFELAGLEE